MATNITNELKKFLNNPAEITLEFSFLDFQSSVFQGIRVVKELTTNKHILKVVLVKNKALGSVSLFFKDGPTYQFALTVEEANLYISDNSDKCLVSKFIVLGNDPILGTQLMINSYSITINAYMNDNKTMGLDSLSFNQIYSDCTSVNSFSYALGIENLKKPTYQEPMKKITTVNSKGSNIYFRIGLILIVLFSISIISNFNRRENTNNETEELEVDTISIDTTASLPEISNLWIEKKYQNFSYSIPESMKLDVNQSNENQQVFKDENNDIGITISYSNLPQDNENETIRSLINNNNRQFAISIYEENKGNFSDIQLIDYDYDRLGNTESFLVTQTSTELSGKNIKMMMKSYFVISAPNYYSIIFSYPENSVNKEEIINKIADSFQFMDLDGTVSNEDNQVTNLDNFYLVTSSRAYFYSQPNENFKTNTFVIFDDLIYAESEEPDYLYSIYVDKNGNKTKGWLLKSNLKRENQQ